MAVPSSRARWWRVTAIVAILFATVTATAAQAPTAFNLAQAQHALTALDAAAPAAMRGGDIDALRDQALALENAASDASVGASAQVAAIDGRLTQLGPAPRGAGAESASLRDQRRALRAQRQALDGQAKQASVVAVGAGQIADRLADRRRNLFNQRWLQRTASPLSPTLWRGLDSTLPHDFARLRAMALEARRTFDRAPQPRTAWALAIASAVAALAQWPLRRWLWAVGRRRAAAEAPASELRRSGYAIWRVLVALVTTGVAVLALQLTAQWTNALSPRAEALAHALVVTTIWISFATQLGRALLSVDRPGWRLPKLSDDAARRFQPYVLVAALVTGFGFLAMRFNSVIGSSLAATVATELLVTLLNVAVAAGAIVARARDREPRDLEPGSSPSRGASTWTLVSFVLSLAILTALGAALTGYTALGARIATAMFLVSVLAIAAYLLSEFTEDAANRLLAVDGVIGRALLLVFGLRTATIQQIAVLASAAARLLVWGAAALLALSPSGLGGSIVGRFEGFDHPVRLGQISVSPGALLAGVVSLVIGLSLVRAVRRWFDTRYLPATDWDAGVRNSVSTALSYLGVTLAIFWGLATAGLGLQRVALIASALSIGIGFGLQQVVQNFVSGLILLVERPIKVGDWVVVGGVEGDVRHIRARATEIQTFDRSTLLVPNAELVTKVVQNKTLGGSLGRVQLRLGVAQPADVATARAAILAACAAHPEVLADPEAQVFIDGLTPGSVELNAFAYVAGPRQAYAVRSDLYFDVLERLRQAEVALAGATQTLTLDPKLDLAALFASTRGPALSCEPPAPSIPPSSPGPS